MRIRGIFLSSIFLSGLTPDEVTRQAPRTDWL
jgi:hypothetical protein